MLPPVKNGLWTKTGSGEKDRCKKTSAKRWKSNRKITNKQQITVHSRVRPWTVTMININSYLSTLLWISTKIRTFQFSDRHEIRGVFRTLLAKNPSFTTKIPSRGDNKASHCWNGFFARCYTRPRQGVYSSTFQVTVQAAADSRQPHLCQSFLFL